MRRCLEKRYTNDIAILSLPLRWCNKVIKKYIFFICKFKMYLLTALGMLIRLIAVCSSNSTGSLRRNTLHILLMVVFSWCWKKMSQNHECYRALHLWSLLASAASFFPFGTLQRPVFVVGSLSLVISAQLCLYLQCMTFRQPLSTSFLCCWLCPWYFSCWALIIFFVCLHASLHLLLLVLIALLNIFLFLMDSFTSAVR